MGELINWSRMEVEIAEARDIDELKVLADKLEAVRILARQSKQSLDVQNKIAEYRLRVERKKGEWLQENVRKGGKGGKILESPDSTLKDIGLTRDESSRAQRIAELSEEDFNAYIQETKETNKEVTLAGAIRIAKQIIRDEKIQQQKEVLASKPPQPPEGLFDVIVIDPPWEYGTKYDPDHFMGRSSNPYPEMNVEQIKAIELPAADNCILWLWTTNQFLPDAFEILEHWGFVHKSVLTWDKVNMGTGYYLRNVTEHCILAVRGAPLWTNKKFTTLLREKRTEHSTKPEGFYAMVDEICFGSKLDYFARKKRDGWVVFGDEVEDKK